MSDRALTLTVVLDHGMRIEDDLQPLISAIGMLRGVISVAANVSDARDYLAVETARHELTQKIYRALTDRADR